MGEWMRMMLGGDKERAVVVGNESKYEFIPEPWPCRKQVERAFAWESGG